MTADFVIPEEARKAARAAAVDRWQTGSADTTQMLLSLDAGLLAALPHLRAHQTAAFEALLAAPNEQFDRRSEILASIEAYSKAVPATASAVPPRATTGESLTLVTETETKALAETAASREPEGDALEALQKWYADQEGDGLEEARRQMAVAVTMAPIVDKRVTEARQAGYELGRKETAEAIAVRLDSMRAMAAADGGPGIARVYGDCACIAREIGGTS